LSKLWAVFVILCLLGAGYHQFGMTQAVDAGNIALCIKHGVGYLSDILFLIFIGNRIVEYRRKECHLT
jgi:hypothetical protein